MFGNNKVKKATKIIASILSADQFKDINVQNDTKVVFNLVLTNPGDQSRKQQIINEVEARLKSEGFTELDVYTTQGPAAPPAAASGGGHNPIGGLANRGSLAPKSPVEGIKHIIAVNSGKGGVGKTTCSINLAIALSKLGHKVGVLDADITGPNVHLMLGITQKPHVTEERKVHSLEAHGIKLISMGTLVDEDKPTIWRGPMLDGVIKQFLRDVEWGEIDYLVVDLPPGTGDAQLTLCQNVPLSGTVVISTPQDVALLDARKSLYMFQKMQVPILGLIENMSFFECPHCNERSEIFAHGGGQAAAKDMGIDFLGAIPIEIKVREGSDNGQPITIGDPDHAVSKAFDEIAKTVVAKVESYAAIVG
ncbi:MAG: Mrp/NBP35 family ATP-binding protein [Candidatus Melainabacteria bacterium]|jgi:ATP-binding protein involved in chromosome partitioning|nr:Mrp/NBP35 family ATP-binding protein [Candidatus Melainabacteria bacterium]